MTSVYFVTTKMANFIAWLMVLRGVTFGASIVRERSHFDRSHDTRLIVTLALMTQVLSLNELHQGVLL